MYCYAAEGDEKGNGKRRGGQRRINFFGGRRRRRGSSCCCPLCCPSFGQRQMSSSLLSCKEKSLFGHRSTILTNYFLLGGHANLRGEEGGFLLFPFLTCQFGT